MNEEVHTFIAGACVGIITSVLTCTIVYGIDRDELRSKSVELGAATWVVDPKTGKTTFTWKESK